MKKERETDYQEYMRAQFLRISIVMILSMETFEKE